MYMCTSRGADIKNAMVETVRCRIWIEQFSLRVVSNSDESTVHATNLRTHDTALPILLDNRQRTVYWATNCTCRRHSVWGNNII